MRRMVCRASIACSLAGILSMTGAASVMASSAPADISNGLLLWLDASDPENDGTPPATYEISTSTPWQDKSGNGYVTIPVGSQSSNVTPWVLSSDIGQQPAFRFSAGNQVAYQIKTRGVDGIAGNADDAELDLRPTALPDITILTVYRTTGPSQDQGSALWGIDNLNWDRMFFNSFGNSTPKDGIVGIGPVGQNVPIIDAGIADTNRLVTVSYQYQANNGSFVSFNGSDNGASFTPFTDTTHLTDQQVTFAIGWDGDNNYAQADIAEVIVYDRALNVCEVHKLNLFLSDKYRDDFWGPLLINDPCIADLLKEIQDYADGDGINPGPLTPDDYRDASIRDVDDDNIDVVNPAILDKDGMDLDTVEKVQKVVHEAIIQAYADTNGASEKPTVEMYNSLGVTGVNQSNIDILNNEIASKGKLDVDTLLELQDIVDNLGAFTININPNSRQLTERQPFSSSAVVVGTPTGSLTWSLSGPDANLFEIDNSGNITQKSALVFDSLPNNPLRITVSATDDNITDSKSLILTILKDTDSDGIADNSDADIDNDGVLNADDDEPSNPLNDSDNDGVANNQDAEPENPNNDSDNDGLPNNLDSEPTTSAVDHDNDGIPTLTENALGLNPLSDDSDGDGVKDASELENNGQGTQPDTDGDGTINALDSDDDGDGILTLRENTLGLNPLSDDSDGDGIKDASELNNNGQGTQPDTDGDGIINALDTDDDGDGISTAIEISRGTDPLNQDSDNDGISDAGVCLPGASCNDTSVPEPQGGVETGIRGAGSLNLLFILVLAALVLGRRYRLLLLALPLAVNAADADKSGFYVGAGIGNSWLEPKTSGDFRVKDKTDTAFKLTAGWDWNEFLSVEGYYARLGESRLSPQGKIDYRMLGADVIGHYWLYGAAREEGSLALYGKGGFNHMTNDGRGLSYKKQKTAQLMFGLGAEYYLPKAFSVRLEWESYDKDASLLSLNLIKRFGHHTAYKAVETPVPAEAEPMVVNDVAEPLPVEDTIAPEVTEPVIVEEAVAVVPAEAVSESIAELDVVIVEIGFALNSAELTSQDKQTLDALISDIQQHSQAQLEVQAHTDNQGSEKYNQALSQRRAEAVVAYMVEQGISSEQLTAVGYGESQPRESNDTAEGRAKNRRVEFKVLQR